MSNRRRPRNSTPPPAEPELRQLDEILREHRDAGRGPVWVCHACHCVFVGGMTPTFSASGGLEFTSVRASQPCPRCQRQAYPADATTQVTTSDGVTHIGFAESPEQIERFRAQMEALAGLRALARAIEAGQVDTDEVPSRIRRLGPDFLALADWIETHKFVTGMILALLAVAIPALQDAAASGADTLTGVIEQTIQSFDE